MLAMWPPGRASRTASSKVAGVPDGLDGDVGAEAAGELGDDGLGVLAAVVDDDVGAELLGGLEPAVGQVDGHDVARAEQPGAHDRRQADRPGADDGDDVAGLRLRR